MISASYDLVPRSRQEIIDLCRREMADVLPETREAKVLKATVIKEVNATFSPEPGVDRWRPAQKTSIENLFLCRRLDANRWPATMEGAVRSGYLAAESVLAEFGQASKFCNRICRSKGYRNFGGSSRQQAGNDRKAELQYE